MSVLRGKSLLLGLSGGIAVYKSASLLRRLTRDHECRVKVVMTACAQQFMSPLIFETFSSQEVITDMFKSESGIVGTRHIDLVLQAGLFAVIPATANIIGKISAGIADDALSTMLTVADPATVLLAPAMNHHMYNNSVVQRNIQQLRDLGYHIVEPGTGALATDQEGWGKGRLPDERTLIFYLEKALYAQDPSPLSGKKVLVSGGPTREYIDDIRFISNPSSGKMGVALAEHAAKLGAEVSYVSGPTALPDPCGCRCIHVESAEDMQNRIMALYQDQNVVIMSAAVEDIRPLERKSGKIKKQTIPASLPLKRNSDILSALGKSKKKQILAGFSVETENGIGNSLKKLQDKNLDLIVLNDPRESGAAFQVNTNKVTLIESENTITPLELMSKDETAARIWERLIQKLK
jgi:phosphopantothenoylcysteine decarboxylase / phosphopantothenate---cysteine ligase